MPWSGTQFKKHNKKLSDAEAKKAGAQATAALKSGVPEGEAIAIANKQAAKDRRKGRTGRFYKKEK